MNHRTMIFRMAGLAVAVSLLAACGIPEPSPSPVWLSPTPRPTPTAAPTPGPYGLLFPLPPDLHPEGGWKTRRLEELSFAFQYPSTYDEGDCGRIFVTEKEGYTLVGFQGVNISIRVVESWEGDLADYVTEAVSGSSSPTLWLTGAEPFSLDGVPAFRLMYEITDSAEPIYGKIAFAAFEGKLIGFEYKHFALSLCDPPPFPEEAVYEHMLSTWEFIR